MKRLRVGVIGAGWVASDRYLPVISSLADIELIGVADRNEANAEAASRRYGVPSFLSVSALLDMHPDAVFICTSPFSHAQLTETVLSHDASVFVEKPMCVHVDEAKKMVELSFATDRWIGVSHNLLFSHSVRRALRRVEDGSVGRVVHVSATQASSPNRRLPHWYEDLPGGLFYDESPHMIYVLDRIVGELVVEDVWATRVSGASELETLGARFSSRDGVYAQLTMIFNAPVSEWLITIVCERGVIVVDLFRDIEFLLPSDGHHGPFQILRTSALSIAGHTSGTIRTGAKYLARRQFWGHDRAIRDFLDSIREDRQPSVTVEDGMRVVLLAHEILDRIDRRAE